MAENILIADDHAIVRLGLSIVIKKFRPGVNIEQADDYQKVLSAIKQQFYDLIILDINMPGGSFQETLELIKIKHPETKVMVFSSQDERVYAIRYLKMGADGFLHKLAPEPDIERAVQKMFNKGSYFSEEVKDALIDKALSKQPNHENPLKSLSDREIEIAEYLTKGAALKEISSELNLHTSTVSTYKTRIFKKMGIATLPELIELFNVYESD